MSLPDRINQDMISALKAGDKAKVGVLRMLKSQFKYKEIETGDSLSEENAIQVLNSYLKKLRESMELYKKGGRDDLFKKEAKEVEIIKEYLPEPLSDSELAEAVNQAISQVNATTVKDIGLVMKSVMDEYRGRVDGKEVQMLVREILS